MTRGTAPAVVLMLAAGMPVAAQSIAISDDVRITPTARLDTDVRRAKGSDDVGLDVARRRIGATGAISSHVEFEIEREIDDGWRDAFVNVRATRAVQVRAGHFKVPFSREQLTGAGALDFIDRSRAADLLSPGRSAGVAVHGRVAGRAVGYEAGGFVSDGTRTGLVPGSWSEPTVAGRVTLKPFGLARRGSTRRAKGWTDVELGIAAVTTSLDEGRESFRGRLASKDMFFAPVFVNGRRLRVGGDLDWRPGPFGVRAEFLRADDARQHQGLAGETLPPIRAYGWSMAGVWAVAGRKAHARANDTVAIAGFPGLELTLRTEAVAFGTPGDAGAQVWTPRAALLSTSAERVWTAGVNWTVNRLVRLQANAVHETVVNRSRGAVSPRAGWSPVVRVQIAN